MKWTGVKQEGKSYEAGSSDKFYLRSRIAPAFSFITYNEYAENT